MGQRGKRNFKKDKRITNDFEWWNKYPSMTAGAGEWPFNQFRGTALGLDGYKDNLNQPKSLPTIMKLSYIPTIGRSTNSESPFMTQVRSLWLDMHRKFRGIGSYQVSDLGVFLFCAINLFADISRAERIYGYFRGAQVLNRSVPFTLLNACDVEYTKNSDTLADFRFALNEINQKASTICLPKGFSAYSDAVQLANCTVKDSDDPRAGIYVFDADVYYTWSGTTYNTGSAAISHERTKTAASGTLQYFSDILADLKSQLTALLNDDDCARMASDILAAYGENGVETRMALAEDYVTPIAKDDNRLLQIHNATICGGYVSGKTWRPSNVLPGGVTGTVGSGHLDITQINNVLVSDLYLTPVDGTAHVVSAADIAACADLSVPGLGNYTIYTPVNTSRVAYAPVRLNDRLLDTWTDTVDLKDKVEMSRFTVPFEYGYVNVTSPYDWIRLKSYGCNVVVRATLYAKTPNASSLDSHNWTTVPQVLKTSGAISSEKWGFTQFDWHPIVYACQSLGAWASPYASNSLKYSAVEIVGDIDHSTVIKDTSEILDKLHEAAILSGYRCENNQTSKFDLT